MRFIACSIQNCEKNAHHDAGGKRGYCVMHYRRIQKHGNPHTVTKPASPALDWLRAHIYYQGNDCLEWPFAKGSDGYGKAHAPGTAKLANASRLMLIFAAGDPPSNKHECAHSCGNGHLGCVNPQHLYWATPKENHADKLRHGTHNRGERQGRCRLKQADITEIRSLLGVISQKEIAAKFNVHPSHIAHIKRGKAWGWL